MAKFSGVIGYAETVQTSPGVYEERITQRKTFGDVLRNTHRFEAGDKINEDLNLNNQISIVGDPYAMRHFAYIRYVEWMGAKWKVTSVDVQPPRLTLMIGGVYNG